MLSFNKCTRLIDLILEQGVRTSNLELLELLDKYQENRDVTDKKRSFIMKDLKDLHAKTDSPETKRILETTLHMHRRDHYIILGMSISCSKKEIEIAYLMNELFNKETK